MTIIYLIFVALGLLAGVGYVDNIIWIIHHVATITPELVLAVIGIFAAPLGIIHGIYVL